VNLKILYDYLMPTHDISAYNALFLKSAKDHIDTIENSLSNIISAQDKKTIFEDIYRRVHSLKGSSSVMQHDNISSTCTEIISIIHPEDKIEEPKDISVISRLVNILKEQIKDIDDERKVQNIM
jgi:chemotaxis protein histidine kinase CheA